VPPHLRHFISDRGFASAKAFCEHPTRESALNMVRTMYVDAKKCKCIVTDWRAAFVRQRDRWVANVGPSGLCGVINVFTLEPADVGKMKTPGGPLLWTLQQKTITTHGATDPLCANPTKNPLFPTITEGSIALSWKAPLKGIDCGGSQVWWRVRKILGRSEPATMPTTSPRTTRHVRHKYPGKTPKPPGVGARNARWHF
jgi:hypothetical protein